MFPSNINGNNYDPFTYIDHSTTPFSKQEDLPLPFFNFPSPYYNQYCDEIELEDHLLFHQQTLTMTDNSVSDTIIIMPDSSKNDDSTIDCTTDCTKKSNNATDHDGHQQILRKRSFSKKDRHSKINTAKGPRDRRMRLSLNVAREFFFLQDMLNYDKASKTVEWLLIQANQEIKKLKANYSPSSTSEGSEVVSGIEKASIEGSRSKEKPSTKERKKVRQPRKTSFRPLARDLREKARVRAKARTRAKFMCTQRNNPSLKATVDEVKEFGSQDDELMSINHGVMIDESSEIMNRWSQNSMFGCQQNAGTNQEHQLTGFGSFGKPWEA